MKAQQILNQYRNFAVVGVSTNPDKYGYKIFKELFNQGYQVYGVSPIYDTLENHQLYSCLQDIPISVDVVVFVVNKAYAKEYVDQMKSLNIQYAWMQPNTYDDELLSYIKTCGITAITKCILVELKNRS